MKTFILIACSIICSVTARNPWQFLTNHVEKGLESTDDFKDWNSGASGNYGNLVKRDLRDLLPETVEETEKYLPERVLFYLYTRNNEDQPQQLFVDDIDTLNNSNFDAGKETKIVTHGWNSNYKAPVCQLILDAYLQNSDCNVILIDWSKIADKEYFWASNRVVIVGQYVAEMVSFLESQGLDANNLTMIGHSLGAHVVGLASGNATEKANYVVGLDPAGPNFFQRPASTRLSKDKGNFVEVIHSDAGLAGLFADLGDADFWPDGGQIQIGCDLINLITCSHGRSYQYFAESINTKVGFIGVQCPNYAEYLLNLCANNPTGVMGGAEPEPGLSGNYYLKTNTKAPFARGYES